MVSYRQGTTLQNLWWGMQPGQNNAGCIPLTLLGSATEGIGPKAQHKQGIHSLLMILLYSHSPAATHII